MSQETLDREIAERRKAIEEFEYLDSVFGSDIETPQLVLAVLASPLNPKEKYKFKETHGKFRKIAQQTAGLACHQHYMHGLILKPLNDTVELAIRKINDKYLDSNMGMMGMPPLDQVLEYRTRIRESLDVDCNYCYHYLEEAFYPIDLTEANLAKLTSTTLPKCEDLDELLDFGDDEFSKLIGSMGRWQLFILGDNCD